MITHDCDLKLIALPYIRCTREPHICRHLVSQSKFYKFLKGDRNINKVDLTSKKLPEQPPKWLGKYGKYQWSKLVIYLNKMDKTIRADEFLVQQFCSAYDIYRSSYDEVVKEGIQTPIKETKLSPTTGEVVSNEIVGYRQNPAIKTFDSAVKQLKLIGSELGLSPKARNEILSLKDTDNKDDISIAEGLKKFLK